MFPRLFLRGRALCAAAPPAAKIPLTGEGDPSYTAPLAQALRTDNKGIFMGFPTSRRRFLQASLLTTTFALLRPAGVLAGLAPPERPAGRLKLYNIHTGERIDTLYRDREGRCDPRAIEALNWLLRCHHTDEQHPIDVRTLDFLGLVGTRLGRDETIHVISGYRSRQYNDYLLSRGHRVARQSLHLDGRALDIRIPGTSLAALRRTALSLRMGGVGYYPRGDFVHIDSGAFRSW